MSKTLPVRVFEWMSDSELENWRNIPSILEDDLEYPKELHDLHNDYSLAPERLKIGNVENLILNLCDRKNYVVHHETLKLYESLSLRFIEKSDSKKVLG